MTWSRRDLLRRALAGGVAAGAAGCSTTGPSTGRPDGAGLTPLPRTPDGADAAAAAAEVGTPTDTAPALPAHAMPRRLLGRTGVEVSLLGIGTSQFAPTAATPEFATRMITLALELGVNYVDTAPNYGSNASRYGNAETKLKEVLRTRRKEIFLVTKVEPDAPTRDGVLRQIEASLARMGVDSVDAVHVHNLGVWDMAAVLGRDGTIAGLQAARDRGLVRFIGTSGHERVRTFVTAIETGAIDLTMNTLNFADRHNYPFEELVVPVAQKKGTGIVAMKVLGGPVDWGHDLKTPANFARHHERAIRYALGIPGVSCAVLGFSNEAELRQGAAVAAAYEPLAAADRAQLVEEGRALAAPRKSWYGPPM